MADHDWKYEADRIREEMRGSMLYFEYLSRWLCIPLIFMGVVYFFLAE